MAPVPIHKNSPINAAKASGVTPETAAPGTGSAESSLPPTRTVDTDASQGYLAARPGAVPPLPVPTGSSLDQRYAPIRPTHTQEGPSQGPPPPQPGAAPVPPSATTKSLPPKAGEAYQPAITAAPTQPSGMPHPPQVAIPAPSAAYAQRGTSTAAGPSGTTQGLQPQPLVAGQSSDVLAHPPGYLQNTNASEFSSYQRAAHDVLETTSGGNESRFSGNDDEGMWGSAKKLAQIAGEKISAAEHEVWRRINKE